jgi:hypothetical protein
MPKKKAVFGNEEEANTNYDFQAEVFENTDSFFPPSPNRDDVPLEKGVISKKKKSEVITYLVNLIRNKIIFLSYEKDGKKYGKTIPFEEKYINLKKGDSIDL